MGVKLRENVKDSGIKSLYLDIISDGKRFKEYLSLHLIPGKTPEIRKKNKEIKQLAESIRANREIELQTQEYNYTPAFKKKIDFIAYYSKFNDEYTHKDKRIVNNSYEWFKKFIEANGIKIIKPKQLNNELCKKFLEHMQSNLKGETPYNYFTKFKRVVRKAMDDGLIHGDPVKGIKVIRDEGLKKEILTIEEIKLLAAAECGNSEIKRAFLFSLYSGLRWCDVSKLTYSNIDYSALKLKFAQSKTLLSSTSSTLTMDLSPTLLKLVGKKKKPDELIFTLPSHAGSLKTLQHWVNRAGITKKISWHCARHSFAVNLLGEYKTDIKTVASLLGHSGLKHTEKYTRAVDELKHKAINALPEIEI